MNGDVPPPMNPSLSKSSELLMLGSWHRYRRPLGWEGGRDGTWGRKVGNGGLVGDTFPRKAAHLVIPILIKLGINSPP